MSAVTKTRTIKYLSVYQDLKEAILSGKYLRGSFLPTEVELTEIYSVSHTTVRKAVSLLQEEKLVHVQQGRGTEVISGESQIRPTAPQIYSDVVSVSSRSGFSAVPAQYNTSAPIVEPRVEKIITPGTVSLV